jgi:hypothetical protein
MVSERIAAKAKLAELRAMLRRIEENRLDADDRATLVALIGEVIEQAEPGQEWLTIELSDDEDDSGEKTDEVDGTVEST